MRPRGMLGFDLLGTGAQTVVVMNDWMSDTSSWDAARPYLDRERFSWVFADLRGYGRSKELRGEFTLREAAADVLELATALRRERFAILGHSMSTLVAMHLAQTQRSRIQRAVLLTPAPPAGIGVQDAELAAMDAIARGSDETRLYWLRMRLGEHTSEGFARFKAERWRAASTPDAVSAYLRMFARDGLPDASARIGVPVLAVSGERDIEPMRREAVQRLLSPLCEQLSVVALADSGHYPMQETPPLLVATIERFLGAE
ncbi:MAG TPA: alpha/beta hydrolase [Polyangiales bacterium]|nr:alpha/beta hydrolase [Polyangiales bacterium]